MINKLEIKYKKNFFCSKQSYFKPTECSGTHKHCCIKPKNSSGGFPQLAGDFWGTTEVINRVVLKKWRCWEVCFMNGWEILQMREVLIKNDLKKIFCAFLLVYGKW
ncbi:hypothetical protein EAG08_18280 [Chryseobacterium sp. 3008163]|nr:hypothetical protein EAG08_18280 [Chryseobacterium sp. 3008163]